jgi:hypothetical protein
MMPARGDFLCGRSLEVEGPNQAHAVNAPIPSRFHMAHHWRRATDVRR